MNMRSFRYAVLIGSILTLCNPCQTECLSPVATALAKYTWQNAKAFMRYLPLKTAKTVAFGPFGIIAGLYLGLKGSSLLGLDPIGYLMEDFSRSRLAGTYKKELINNQRDLVGSIIEREDVQAVIRSINGATLQHPAQSVLLFGAPGYGKTELAYRIAYETKCPIVTVACAGINAMGTGAQTLQSIFNVATKNPWYTNVKKRVSGLFVNRSVQKPTIILLDEIDSIADKQMAWGDRALTLNKLLTIFNHIPGEDPQNKNFVVIATTNKRPIDLYDSLMRPGRIGVHINITETSEADRSAILEYYAAKNTCQPNIDWQELAHLAEHFSGADLKGTFEGAMARDDHNTITQANMTFIIHGMLPEVQARRERRIAEERQLDERREREQLRYEGILRQPNIAIDIGASYGARPANPPDAETPTEIQHPVAAPAL